jgi:signal peptidase I
MGPQDRIQLPGQVFPGTVPPNGHPAPAQTVAPAATPKMKKAEEPTAVKDAFREVVETVVFVVVLVLLLKTFVAEAFVIPTGSMAETLLGYQKWATCPECGEEFPVNCSSEVDPQQGPPIAVVGCTCPNCRYKETWIETDAQGRVIRTLHEPPKWGSGDRVLVSKFPYDNGRFGAAGTPHRADVVVFKYPEAPQKAQTPMNYIKRLWGLPGETVGIFNGDVYILPAGILDYPEERDPNDPAIIRKHPRPEDPKDLWKLTYTYPDDADAMRLFHEGAFKIFRKSPDLIHAMRRLVYDNDHQPKDLVGKVKPRWQAKDGWASNDENVPRVFRQKGTSGEQPQMLRYQHLIVDRNRPQEGTADPKPSLITNYMGYNTGELAGRGSHQVDTNWVGDLMIECTATVEAVEGDLFLELSKGGDRFQARFDLQKGTVSLSRLNSGQVHEVAAPVPAIAKSGTYKIGFANIDSRLTVWVDGKLPYQDANGGDDRKQGGVDYPPWIPPMGDPPGDPKNDPNNLEPASIGVARGAKLSVAHLQLWRDTYFVAATNNRPSDTTELKTMYVQPGHFLCLGDNSSESSDSRYWGLVPQRLLLGRAVMVYWPLSRAGVIR